MAITKQTLTEAAKRQQEQTKQTRLSFLKGILVNFWVDYGDAAAFMDTENKKVFFDIYTPYGSLEDKGPRKKGDIICFMDAQGIYAFEVGKDSTPQCLYRGDDSSRAHYAMLEILEKKALKKLNFHYYTTRAIDRSNTMILDDASIDISYRMGCLNGKVFGETESTDFLIVFDDSMYYSIYTSSYHYTFTYKDELVDVQNSNFLEERANATKGYPYHRNGRLL